MMSATVIGARDVVDRGSRTDLQSSAFRWSAGAQLASLRDHIRFYQRVVPAPGSFALPRGQGCPAQRGLSDE